MFIRNSKSIWIGWDKVDLSNIYNEETKEKDEDYKYKDLNYYKSVKLTY